MSLNGAETGGGKPSAVGWEKNPQGKLGARVADLAPMMDPTRCVSDLSYFLCRRPLPQTSEPSSRPEPQTNALADSPIPRSR